jgi:hypothetical protein
LLMANVKMPAHYSWAEHALGQGPANGVIESLSHRVEKTWRTSLYPPVYKRVMMRICLDGLAVSYEF